MRIPALDARTLTHKSVRVPADFTGVRNVVLVAFERSHLILYPPWRAALGRLLLENRKIGCYGLYLAGAKSGWRRRMIEIGLRMETPDSHAREHIAVAYVEPVTWCEQAGLVLPDVPLIVVSDPSGRVTATSEGDPSEPAIHRISSALRL